MERECTCFLKDCCLKSATKNIILLISNNLMIVATEMDLKGAAQGRGRKYEEFLGKKIQKIIDPM